MRIQLEDMFERFTPRVPPDQYTLTFVPSLMEDFSKLMDDEDTADFNLCRR